MQTVGHGYETYRNFIVENPVLVNEVESAVRWFSYLTAASKYTNSHVIAEFVFTSANLLQLLNDSILRKAANIKVSVNASVARLQTLLQVLEYTSVFTEFTANRFASKVGRLLIIGLLQTTKAIIKLVLLLKYEQGLQRQQPVLPLDRRSDLTCLQRNHNKNLNNNPRRNGSLEVEEANPEGEAEDEIQTLRRSGRVLRTLDKAPGRSQRTWMLPTNDPNFRRMIERSKVDAPPSFLSGSQLLGEVFHIAKPVVHLSAVGICGQAAWTPYLLALGLDASSLKMLHEPVDKVWNHNESVELGQRSFALLLYLLRSPFYDVYTKDRILRTLSFFADKIPIFGRLIRPLLSYLPEWQKTYFYVWAM
ncbi:Peroxisomal membrane protein PEX16 [Halotydeus destructor]|nr:Peroxisomal membrane protein PEX16 [Halotydeus destructor]